MKRTILLLSLILLFGINACTKKETSSETNSEKQLENYKTEFRKYAKDYLLGLKAVLKRNLKKGGTLKGVTVCADTASDLTKMFSEAVDLKVRRVSFKNRNPKNVPDEIEADILNQYKKMLILGKLTKKTETFGKYELNGKEIIRYMKPIIIEDKCLQCHGNAKMISKDVKDFLKKKYPNDKAVNYSAGELRGAVSITKEL